MRKLTLSLAALVGAAALAAGCSHPPQTGYVTAKHYSAPYTIYITQCFARNKQGMCTLSVPVPHHYPARWELCLRADPQENSDKTGCFDVDQPTWDKYNVGQHYPDAR